MEQNHLIKLVRTYRLSEGLAEQLQLGDEIFRLVEPKLRFLVFGLLTRPAAEDVLQEALKAIATGMSRFEGKSTGEFWAWCYGIARNKVADQLRRKVADRMQPTAPEELWRLVEVSARHSPLLPEDRLDLEHAMNLLRQSKPECYDYLWKHFVLGLAYGEIAEEEKLSYDNARMRVNRCLDEAQSLVA